MTQDKKKNWHDHAFWGIHFDWHTQSTESKIGEYLTREYMIEFLKELQPDWIQVDCKGHPGICCWPTKLGVKPENLSTDPLKASAEAAEELNIPLGIHYSGVIDIAQMQLHPEWAIQDANGNRDDQSSCCLGDYTDFMIAHLKEAIHQYPIRSIWVDGECWGVKPCWCPNCREEFQKEYHIPVPLDRTDPNWDKFLEFHRNNFVRHVQRYTDELHAEFPDLLICSNWMYSARMPGKVNCNVDYLSGDFDPSWGAVRAATESRMFDTRKRDFGLSWDLMLWSFAHSFDTPAPVSHVIKPLIQMQQEATEVLAHGGAIMLYDQPERNGRIPDWKRHYYKALHQWCMSYQSYCTDSRSASTIAILHTVEHMRNFCAARPEYCDDTQSKRLFDHTFACQAMEGALHFMLESGFSCDIITEDSLKRLSQYQLIIVPEQVAINQEVFETLKSYIKTGGNVIFTGNQLSEEVQQLTGVSLGQAQPYSQLYAQVDTDVLPLPRAWAQSVTLQEGTTPLQLALSSFCPENQTEIALATLHSYGQGKVLGIYGDIFRDYYLGHYPTARRFLNQLLQPLLSQVPYSLAGHGSRPYLELVARQQNQDLLLHLINRSARETLSPNRPMVSEITPITDVELLFADSLEGKQIESTLAQTPERSKSSLKIHKIEIYEIIRIRDYFVTTEL